MFFVGLAAQSILDETTKTIQYHVLKDTLKLSLGKYHIFSSLFMDRWKCDRIGELEIEINSSWYLSWGKGFSIRFFKPSLQMSFN